MVSRKEVAWHEAGHAAAIKALGELNGTVELHGHGSGVTYYRHSLFFGTTVTRGDYLQICIAGSLVESRHSRYGIKALLDSQTGWGGKGDGDKVFALLHGDSLDHWIRKTDRLLRGYGRELNDLADALDECGSLSGRDASAILSGRR